MNAFLKDGVQIFLIKFNKFEKHYAPKCFEKGAFT
jgi:hypothetical protein